jgi:hypothetical protein
LVWLLFEGGEQLRAGTKPPGAYVWHASIFTREVLDGLIRIGFLYPQQIIWNKGRTVLSVRLRQYTLRPTANESLGKVAQVASNYPDAPLAIEGPVFDAKGCPSICPLADD